MPDSLPHSPKQNRILAALSASEFARLQDDLEPIFLSLGQALFESGDSPGYVYFPITCIVSLLFTTRKGASAELAITGKDGLVGIPLVLGGNTTTHRAVIQSEGVAYRLKIEVMRWELDQGGELQHLALRYTQALMTQMAQSVVCNRHHSVDQQLCRWLLLSLDRLPGNQLNMTQELIGNMLGVRREAVTEAAGKLQAAGLIQYSRGRINVVDRPGLEARACECYAVVKSEYDRLFQLDPTVRLKGRSRPHPETLRKRAETRLRQSLPDETPSAWDNAQLVHELQIHQIELEMHNEELRHAYDEADNLLDRYADVYDFAPISYFTLDREGVVIDMNLAGSILLGVKSSQKGRYRFASRIAPENLPDFNQFFAEVFQAKNKTVGEFVLSPTSHRPEVTVTIEAVPDEGGEECRMVVIDISAIKAADKALRERETYLRAVIDNFPFLVWLKDNQGRFLAVNTTFAKNFGWSSPDELIGKSDFDISFPETAEMAQAEDRAVLQSGEQKTVVQEIEAGDVRHWLEVYKSPVSLAGKPVGTVGFGRDITESHDTQLALKSSEKRYRNFIEKMPLGVAILQDATVRYINPKCVELIGHTADECIGKSFLPLLHEDDRAWAMEAHRTHTMGQLEEGRNEIRLLKKDGQVADCLMHVSTVEWDGRAAVLAIFEDVTARKQAEAELQRLASIDPLTELATRQHFFVHVEQELSRLKRRVDHGAALVLINLDHFETMADAIGRLSSDAVLRLFSALLRDELRKIDFAARIENELFAVLIPDADLATAQTFAERLRKKVAETSIVLGRRQEFMTVSIGIATLSIDDKSPDFAYSLAEQALARAQDGGGNRISLAETSATGPVIKKPGVVQDRSGTH